MKRFNIFDHDADKDFGTHEATTSAEALDVMARSRGFTDFANARPRFGTLVVTEVKSGAPLPAAVDADAVTAAAIAYDNVLDQAATVGSVGTADKLLAMRAAITAYQAAPK